MSLCPEAEKRAAMTDGEFWDYVLLGHEPGWEVSEEWDGPPPEDEFDRDGPSVPCPECGGHGACAYDQEGRPLIHAVFREDEPA